MMNNASQPSGTAMKPQTAAKKLGIYLPATPEEFQQGGVTHVQLKELHTNPPEWLVELRRNGPHPRPVVAQKLGISTTALKKNNMDKPLTSAEIAALLEEMPEWLEDARKIHAEHRQQEAKTQETKSQETEPGEQTEVSSLDFDAQPQPEVQAEVEPETSTTNQEQ